MTNQDTKIFIDTLFHNDRNSNIIIAHLKDGKMTSCRRRLSEIQDADFSNADTYISCNSFVGWRRVQSQCRQINGWYFDLDCHDDQVSHEMREWKIQHTLMLLQDAYIGGSLPQPNMILHTGRGLALYYVLENSISYRLSSGEINEKAIYLYNKIREDLSKKMQTVLAQSPYTLTLDNSVYDISRLCRVPGTINSKSGTVCEILAHNEDYYTFSDFGIKKTMSPKAQKPKPRTLPKSAISDTDYHRIGLQRIRIEELEKLQQHRQSQCKGCRYYMTFLYYNAVTQIYDHEDAVAMTHQFVSKFAPDPDPFLLCEIEAIINSVDHNKGGDEDHLGHYKITKAWIIDKLAITKQEIEELDLFATHNLTRRLKKLQNQETKRLRNERILELAASGVKRQDIANQLGITKATVQNILKANNATRPYKSKSQIL